MHAQRPYGLAVYGGELTDDDLAFIDSIAKRLTNIKRTGKLDSLKLVYDLPNGGAVIVYDMGGVFRAIANKPTPTPQDDEHDYMAHSHIPMLYSGVVVRSIVGRDEGVILHMTEWTKRRIGEYRDNYKPMTQMEFRRFVIDYHHRVREFEPNPPPPKKHTQYTRQRPTWYSGSMAKVMQIVGGYGRQDLENLPDKYWERATIKLPYKVKQAIDNELKDKLLPAYTGYPPKDGQYQYDYKHSLTHGVGFDDENKPWLLSISRRGVYAMPLPMIPATTTTAYREWIKSVGDGEILSILDTFGGLPSGESFPANDHDFYAWQRAGAIVRICDTADFYDHIAYSTACGWSLNTKGSDGYNTCYDYNDKGLAVGYTYNMTLTLKSADDGGRVVGNQKTLPDYQAQELAEYLVKIMNKLDKNTARGASIRYKLRRLTDKELYGIIGATVDDLDNLILPPIAKHSGQVRKVYEGVLYHPARFEFQPQIKFAEPLMNACLSFDFGILEGYPKPNPPPKCDTVMWAYFADDDLKVVKYFYDETQTQVEVDTNFEEYMTAGSWYRIITNGASRTAGHFYHSDLDDRETVAPHITETTIKGDDKGYDTKPHFAFFEPWHMQGTIWRYRYYTHLTKTKTYGSHAIDIALCVPFYVRDGVIYANRDSKSDVSEHESLKLEKVQDPTIYHYWTYDSVMHWRGGAYPPAKGNPYPKDSNPVWVEASSYCPHPSNQFADNGEWLGGGFPKDLTWLVHPDSNTWHLSGGGNPPKIQEYSKSTRPQSKVVGYVSLSMYPMPKQVHKNVPKRWYFISSPDRYGNYFYKDACKNLMGDTEYSNVSEQVDGKRKAWGNSQFMNSVGHDTAHHFIGVINE